ncbi:MAG: NYN domain-containing protein [Thermoleophilia bacterium]
MAEPTLYLVDGSNVAHAAGLEDREALVDLVASWLALRGARGVLVLDGHGRHRTVGPVDVRYAPHADTLLERLAAEHRGREVVAVVSSDRTLIAATGLDVQHRPAAAFAAELRPPQGRGGEGRDAGPAARTRLEDGLPADLRERLERLRRGG